MGNSADSAINWLPSTASHFATTVWVLELAGSFVKCEFNPILLVFLRRLVLLLGPHGTYTSDPSVQRSIKSTTLSQVEQQHATQPRATIAPAAAV
jgi:hypothetical protein